MKRKDRIMGEITNRSDLYNLDTSFIGRHYQQGWIDALKWVLEREVR